MPTQWNYPEAFIQGEVGINNITGVTSRDRTSFDSPVLFGSFSPGNFSVDNAHIEDYYLSTTDIVPNFYSGLFPSCYPSYGKDRVLTGNNINISLRNPNNEFTRANVIVFGGEGDAYTKNVMNITNIHIYDYNNGFYIPFVIDGAVNDDVYITNILIEDSTLNFYASSYNAFNKLIIKNYTYQNTIGMTYAGIYTLLGSYVEIDGATIKNYTGTTNPVNPIFTFNNFEATEYKFNSINIQDSNLLESELVNFNKAFIKMEITNSLISNSTIASGKSLITLATVKHFEVANYTINGFTNSDLVNDGSTVIRVNAIDMDSEYDTEIFHVSFHLITNSRTFLWATHR
jgi:hypothetical protein